MKDLFLALRKKIYKFSSQLSGASCTDYVNGRNLGEIFVQYFIFLNLFDHFHLKVGGTPWRLAKLTEISTKS